MTDDNIKQLLRRYEPSGPPPDMRARVLAATVDVRRTWPWAVAAALLLASSIGLPVASMRSVTPWTSPLNVLRAEEIAELTEMFGGTDEARRTAELIVAQEAIANEMKPVARVGVEGFDR